ncbi:MAG: DUF1501 domain-containing protein, partial [Gimesia chilikensis]
MNEFQSTRRDFLRQASATGLAASALGTSWQQLLASEKHGTKPHGSKKLAMPVGKAEHCIMIWLGGGSCHIDTWDPKRKGDPKAKKAGSYYDPIPTAIKGTEVCEHLSKCAPILDRFNIVRSVHHEVIDEHAAATNRMHTGRPTTGT